MEDKRTTERHNISDVLYISCGDGIFKGNLMNISSSGMSVRQKAKNINIRNAEATNRFLTTIKFILLSTITQMMFDTTYPDKVAAAVELCGGTTLKDVSGLTQIPLWIFHGTADKAVPLSASQKVIAGMESSGGTDRLIFTKLQGFNHGAPAKILYLKETYNWLLEHSLTDKGRPVNRTYDISPKVIRNAYQDLHR